MRLCLILLLGFAGCPQRLQVKDEPTTESAGPPACVVHARRLSPAGSGREGTRPAVAASKEGYGVVWEDTVGEHRGIRFQALDREAAPLASSVEVADLEKGGAEPRLIVDGDGFVVSWTVEQGQTSVIALRRIDARGKPKGDAVPVVSAPSARALALSRFGDGYALVWWSWAASPPLQAATFVDGECRPRGKNVEISRSLLVEPMADLLPLDNRLQVAWEEQHDGVGHVFAGSLSPDGLAGRVDLGPGDSPSLTQKGAVFAHLDDASIWWSPIDGGAAKPARFTDGQYPDARPLGPDRGVLCVVRLAVTEEGSYDELDCMTLHHGEPVRDDKIAQAARGLQAQDVAVGTDGFAVVYQTQEADGDAVHLATAKCP